MVSGRKTTLKEMLECHKWFKALKTQVVKVDDSDLVKESAQPQAADLGADTSFDV